MKKEVSNNTKQEGENPVREGTPNSISEEKSKKEKQQYPFPSKEDKQYKDQPEFIDPGSNSSKNE